MSDYKYSALSTLIVFGLWGGWWASDHLDSNYSVKRIQNVGALTNSGLQDPEKNETPTFPDRKELVKDWEKPEVTLLISGSQRGYIEPCGCTGLENQKGGLMRRRDCQKVLLDRGWNVVALDLGDQIRRQAIQPQLKLRATYETLTKVMGYRSIGLGVNELKLASTELAQLMVNCIDSETPFTCCNITVLDESFVAPYHIVETGGRRLGVVMVVGDEHLKEIESSDIQKSSANDGIKRALQAISKLPKCDALILLAQTDKESCMKFARQYPFDLIVVGDCPGEPTLMSEPVFNDRWTTEIIEVGTKGMHIGLVGCSWVNGKLQLKYERVPLDARFADAPDAKAIFAAYQKELEILYTRPENFPDIQPRQHPSGLTFVGSERCNDCHDEEFDIWKDGIDGNGGPHFRATVSLFDPKDNPRADIPRNFDPECLSCHVTGWNPQNFFPYQSGYKDLVRDAHLHGNGCENCHGPGKEHADAEEGNDVQLQEKLRNAMRLELKDAEKTCLECHDIDNSPDFLKKGFDYYWKYIEH
ncbi:MAG: hypothetical protein KF851_05865 [Pirellulaceae bacterium]|nr:hypothetical protein [Pirellulaceae bacterium]